MHNSKYPLQDEKRSRKMPKSHRTTKNQVCALSSLKSICKKPPPNPQCTDDLEKKLSLLRLLSVYRIPMATIRSCSKATMHSYDRFEQETYTGQYEWMPIFLKSFLTPVRRSCSSSTFQPSPPALFGRVNIAKLRGSKASVPFSCVHRPRWVYQY